MPEHNIQRLLNLRATALTLDDVEALQEYCRKVKRLYDGSRRVGTRFVIDDLTLARVHDRQDYIEFHKRKASADFGVEMCKQLTWKSWESPMASIGGGTTFEVSALVWPQTLREDTQTL